MAQGLGFSLSLMPVVFEEKNGEGIDGACQRSCGCRVLPLKS